MYQKYLAQYVALQRSSGVKKMNCFSWLSNMLKPILTATALIMTLIQAGESCTHTIKLVVNNEPYFDTKGYSLDYAQVIPTY